MTPLRLSLFLNAVLLIGTTITGCAFWFEHLQFQEAIMLCDKPKPKQMSQWQPYSPESLGIDTKERCEAANPRSVMVKGTINQWKDGRCGYIFPMGETF